MSDPQTVYILTGYLRSERRSRILRVFNTEHDAEKWAAVIECAIDDPHFPVTHAELRQEYDWIPDRKFDKLSVSAWQIHNDGDST